MSNLPLAVYYSGSSGGCFFALTLALATQETHKISSTQSIHEIIDKNWKIDKFTDWDKQQVIYDHNYYREGGLEYNKTVQHRPAIIKYDDFTSVVAENAIPLMIYTDVHTHFALITLKHKMTLTEHPGPFAENCSMIVKLHIEKYNSIKDADWPDVNVLGDFIKLPVYVQNAIDNSDYGLWFPEKIGILDSWYDEFKMRYSRIYNGVRIFKNEVSYAMLDGIEHSFLLQDVVKTKFKCVTDALGLKHTPEVSNHVDFWVSLHPAHIQKLFYKDVRINTGVENEY